MNFFSRLVLFLSPIGIFTISGKSMEPVLHPDEKIITVKLLPIKKRDIIVCHDPVTKRLLVKRVKDIKNNTYFVVGDNKTESTDSRDFGWIKKKDVLGKVIYTLQA